MKNLNSFFMDIAEKFSTLSTCERLKVGAVITKNNRIISTGYNGVPSGLKHCCEIHKDIDFSIPENNEMHKKFSAHYELHAEQNAIVEAAKNGIALNDSILYTTVEPCDYCRKLIAQSGIKKVFYRYKYDRNQSESDFIAEKLGLLIEQI